MEKQLSLTMLSPTQIPLPDSDDEDSLLDFESFTPSLKHESVYELHDVEMLALGILDVLRVATPRPTIKSVHLTVRGYSNVSDFLDSQRKCLFDLRQRCVSYLW